MGGNNENDTKPSCGLSFFFCLTYIFYFIASLYIIYLFRIPAHLILCVLSIICTIIAAARASKCALVFCYIFVILNGLIESFVFSSVVVLKKNPKHVQLVEFFFPLRSITTILFLIAATIFVNKLIRQKNERIEKEKRESDIEAVKLSIQKDEQTARPVVPVVVYTNQHMPAEHYLHDTNKNAMMAYNAAPVNPQYATPMNNPAFNPNMNAPAGQYMNNNNNMYVGPTPNNFMPNQYRGPNGV